MKHAKTKSHIAKHARKAPVLSGHKGLLSVFLCLAMILGSFGAYPTVAVTGSELKSVTVLHEGKKVDHLTLPESERAELTAVCVPAPEGTVYQWQILADPQNETWANIYDGTAERLTVSYALVQALLDVSGSAYVRCRATFSGDQCVSSPVCVTVEYLPPFGEGAAASLTGSQKLQKSMRVAAAQENSEDQMVNISINYLDGVSGLAIYSSYTGSVNVTSEEYVATVISPTYLGYEPRYNAANPAATLPDTSGRDHRNAFPDSAPTINLIIPKGYAQSRYVVNVYYFASDVPYAARYFFQNIHDDQYTENVDLYKTGTAKTGTIISDQDLAVDESLTVGFTKLHHYPEAVAADGSTVFECYYDRNYCMLKFDVNGGYGVEPIYARYGTPFLVNEPTRHGYVFAGWDKQAADGTYDGVKDALPATIPNENQTYRAIWEQADTTYNVAYWLQNADDDDYAYIGTKTMSAKSGSTVKVGGDNAKITDLLICGNTETDHTHTDDCKLKHAKYYELDAEKNKDISVTVNGNGSTVLNVYYTRKYYTLRFIYAKETSAGSIQVVGGSTYGFGNANNNTSWLNKDYSLDELLNNVNSGQWGEVKELPQIDSNGAKYVTGAYPESKNGVLTGVNYHYFEITARFGADLTELWPTDVFGRVPVKDPSTHTKNNANSATDNDGWGNYAYLAGWNGEYKVQYSIDNSNSTVKGLYQKLDEHVLLGSYNGTEYTYEDGGVKRQTTTQATKDRQEVSSNVCYFLGFFDNGANISWSVPRQWTYDLYVPVFENEVPKGSALYKAIIDAASANLTQVRYTDKATGGVFTFNRETTDRTYTDPDTGKVYYYYNETIYRLYDRVSASDDNVSKNSNGTNGQTQTTLSGFSFNRSEAGNEVPKRCQQMFNGELADGRLSFTSRFFYTREPYKITLHSHNTVYKTFSVPFDSPMNDKMLADGQLLTPPYPDTLEKNAYYFDGWYASPECIDGTHYEPAGNYVMPATDVVLYAKWAPTKHTVRFFRTRDDMLRYTAGDTSVKPIEEKKVPHGNVLGTVDNPEDQSGYHYTFGGWFYEENSKRLAYTPLDTPVVKDMNVFASWGSMTAQPYRIYYALHDPETTPEWIGLLSVAADAPGDNGVYTVTNGTVTRTYIYLASDKKFHLRIADDSHGYAYQGSTRTFVPKVGDPYDQLYSDYSNGYYPTLASHSITMEYEENKENPEHNVFTFTYVHVPSVDYRVEYRYADTNKEISDPVTRTTSDAVITERFKTIADYIPDAFFKRLILAVEKDENGNYVGASTNVVVFYYSKNTTSAYYAVHYMLQNIGADTALDKNANGQYKNYTESSAHTEGIGDVGQVCAIPPQTFSGFTVQTTARVISADATGTQKEDPLPIENDGNPHFNITVSQDGTELYIFYTRKIQEYKVYYLKYGTDIRDLPSFTASSEGVLRIDGPKSAQFGETVTESAEKVSFGGWTCVSALLQSIQIRSINEQNYIVFYYAPVQRTIEYKTWVYGGGTLDNTIEVFNGENVEIKGSTPTALEGYTFSGWYLDEAGTVPVGDKGSVDASTGHLDPVGERLTVMPQVNVFYARFTPINDSLTITRKNGENDESSGRQVFVYTIRAKNDPSYVIHATMAGNGSVTIKGLPCREYTVTQENSWSWRYGDASQTVVVKAGGTNEAIFDAAADTPRWLNGNSQRITNRKG